MTFQKSQHQPEVSPLYATKHGSLTAHSHGLSPRFFLQFSVAFLFLACVISFLCHVLIIMNRHKCVDQLPPCNVGPNLRPFLKDRSSSNSNLGCQTLPLNPNNLSVFGLEPPCLSESRTRTFEEKVWFQVQSLVELTPWLIPLCGKSKLIWSKFLSTKAENRQTWLSVLKYLSSSV